MRELVNAPQMTVKFLADLAPLKWLAAVAMVALDYVLPTSEARNMAIGAAFAIVLDTVTGFLVGWQSKSVSSAKASRALVKFLGYGAVLGMTAIVTKNVPGMKELASLGTTGVMTLIIVTEGVSVLENCLKLGLKLPFGLAEALRQRLANVPDEPPKKD